MTRETFLSLVLTRVPKLDGEGAITIERTAIHRLIKQSYDAGHEEATRTTPQAAAITSDKIPNIFKEVFGKKTTQ